MVLNLQLFSSSAGEFKLLLMGVDGRIVVKIRSSPSSHFLDILYCLNHAFCRAIRLGLHWGGGNMFYSIGLHEVAEFL